VCWMCHYVVEVRPCSGSSLVSDKLSLVDNDAARVAGDVASCSPLNDDDDDDVAGRVVFPVKPAEHTAAAGSCPASPACSDERTSAEGRTCEQDEQTENDESQQTTT